jgi:hypothetical protein
MIDRIWYLWQLRSSTNKGAFGGGSISIQVDPVQAAAYPNGAPPNLAVPVNPSNLSVLVVIAFTANS